MQSNNKQLILDIKIDQKEPIWDDFIVDESNEPAYSSISKNPKDWLSYLLMITGPIGSGKTMLSQLWTKEHKANTINDFQDMENAITKGNRGNLLFSLDLSEEKIKSLSNDTKKEEVFFHFLNFIKNNNGKILITARTTPNNWNIKTKDLASRLNAATIVEISQPSDNLLMYGLQKILSDKQIKVDKNTIKYIISHSERSFAFINKIADIIEEIAEENKSKISIQKLKKKLS